MAPGDFDIDGTSPPSDPRPQDAKTPKTPVPRTPANQDTDEYDRDAVLRKELEGVRNINASIEGIISTLEKAKSNMGTVSHTVGNASTLLNTWTPPHPQPEWRGATQDMQEMEAEALQKQQAAERKAAEDERRREAARRKREEEEAERTRPTIGRTPSVRGRATARVRSRGTRGTLHTRGSSISGTTGSRIGRGASSTSTRAGSRGRGTT
ncbi:hypothetical protein EV126DRAFT_527513 [Verticillium dahliae]|nr:hypothetical protein EV126DRAFT_527513 [Verticillium dahliae]